MPFTVSSKAAAISEHGTEAPSSSLGVLSFKLNWNKEKHFYCQINWNESREGGVHDFQKQREKEPSTKSVISSTCFCPGDVFVRERWAYFSMTMLNYIMDLLQQLDSRTCWAATILSDHNGTTFLSQRCSSSSPHFPDVWWDVLLLSTLYVLLWIKYSFMRFGSLSILFWFRFYRALWCLEVIKQNYSCNHPNMEVLLIGGFGQLAKNPDFNPTSQPSNTHTYTNLCFSDSHCICCCHLSDNRVILRLSRGGSELRASCCLPVMRVHLAACTGKMKAGGMLHQTHINPLTQTLL